MPEIRFDDLRSRPTRSRSFQHPRHVLEATDLEHVIDVMEEVTRRTDEGAWAAGFISYEAAPAFDSDLRVRMPAPDDPFAGLPLAWFGIFDAPIEPAALLPGGASYGVYRWDPSVAQRDYERQVEQIRDFIRDGEAYQINHTIRLRGRGTGSARAFYTALALAQRGSHNAFVDTGRFRLLSASPESFFALDADGTLTTKPMKGTAPRGRFPVEDAAAAERLVTTLKERAENAMIVDLLRNDMGRISEAGSVDVTELFEVERYETVWQMTSTITSELRDDVGLVDVFRALFPSGSVTGAPKVRSMQIISDLETLPRGVYCGAIGWIAPANTPGLRADFNVAIRTVAWDRETDTVEYGVGGGITYDSDPAAEYRECVAKSRVLTTRRPAFDLLETMACVDDEIDDLQEHLERMEASANYFGFDFDPMVAAAAATTEAAIVGSGVIRLTVAPDGSAVASSRPLPIPSGEPVSLALDREPVDPDDALLFHKTTLRAPYDHRAARHADADQVVLCNRHGRITETTIANIAIRREEAWVTPPLEDGLLPGIERAALLDAGTIHESPVTIEDLQHAREIAVFNSVRGWQAARLLDPN